MLFFHQMGQDQPLPVPLQLILAAGRSQAQPAARLPGLHQQMHLRVVPQRLVMPDALHGVPDRLPVQDAALAEAHLQPEAVRKLPLQDFQLHLAHELRVDFSLLRRPDHMELGILLLHLAQPLQQGIGIRPLRQYLIVEDRGQQRFFRALQPAQAVPRPGGGRPRHRADLSRLGFLRHSVFLPAVQADLIYLLLSLPHAQQRLHLQASSQDLHPGQPGALGVPGDLEHPGGEFLWIVSRRNIPGHGVQQGFNALHLQGAAEQAGEKLPFAAEPGGLFLRNAALRQEGLHGAFVAYGDLLRRLRRLKIHAAVAEPVLDLPRQRAPVRPGLIHLVDEQDHRHPVGLQQAPEGQGMPLHPVRAADQQHRPVQHAQGSFHFAGKIHVSRGVHQGDLHPPPVQLRLLGKDGDSPLPLLNVRIQEGVPMIHPARLSQPARGIKQRFGQRGFSRVHMGQQPDHQAFFLHGVFLPSRRIYQPGLPA